MRTRHAFRPAVTLALAVLVTCGSVCVPATGIANQEVAVGGCGDPRDGFGGCSRFNGTGGNCGDPTDRNGGDPTDGEGRTYNSGDPTDGEDRPVTAGDPGDGSEAFDSGAMPMVQQWINALCDLYLFALGLRVAR